MSKKRILISVVLIALLAGLVYLQVREWKHFDWAKLKDPAHRPAVGYIVAGIALIYADYVLRAVRWKLFLRPVCDVSWRRLLGPTMVGFTAIALLGRPGEFVRPYIIARKENLTMSSQMAVWAVERIFDTGAFALILALDLIFARHILSGVRHYHRFQLAGLLLIALVVAASLLLLYIYRRTEETARWVERRMSHAPHLSHKIALRVREFGGGLRTIHTVGHFAKLSLVSMAVWIVIAGAYLQVVHAYPELHHMRLSHVLLLMGSAMVGSVVQLPAVGGGSQLATIGVLIAIFEVSPEVATSCGILLWLVTFMMVIPVGLILAHREHISFREATRIAAAEEERAGG